MGITVSVYRDSSENRYGRNDSTNGGLSSRFTRLTVVNVEGPFSPTKDAPAVILVGNAFGDPILVPAFEVGGEWFARSQDDEFAGPMFGGNYAGYSDSRWTSTVRAQAGHGFYGAVPIHDRFESWDLYRSNSL